jgi:hypothetical protein
MRELVPSACASPLLTLSSRTKIFLRSSYKRLRKMRKGVENYEQVYLIVKIIDHNQVSKTMDSWKLLIMIIVI